VLSVQLFALYHLGMVPGILDFKGSGKGVDYYVLFRVRSKVTELGAYF